MERLPILMLLLYSIPESIVLMSFGSTLYGYNIKENFNRIALLGSVLALTTYVVRLLPIEVGPHMIIQIPVFIILTVLFLRVSLIRAFFMVMSAAFVVTLGETISFSLMSYLAGLTVKQIIDNVLWRLLTGWIHLSVILFVTIFLSKKKIALVKTPAMFCPRTGKRKIRLSLTALVLTQAFLTGLLSLTIYFSNKRSLPVFNDPVYIMTISVSLFVISMISGFFIRRMFLASEHETVLETYETFLNNFNKLYTTVRGQRHDFLNHVQVLYSLMQERKNEDAMGYMNNLMGEIKTVNACIKTQDPVLNGILHMKTAVAEGRNISFGISITTNLEKCRLKPLDMVKVLGNLVDNAMEAVDDQPQELRNVKVSICREDDYYIFEVSNRGPVIEQDRLKRIFESGFTTKDNHTGLGLAVVKDLVEQYGGEITARTSEQEGTVFKVAVPV